MTKYRLQIVVEAGNPPRTRVRLDGVFAARERDEAARCCAPRTDTETVVVVGYLRLPETVGGTPSITVDEAVEMMGGAYRCASILVDVLTKQLARHNRRISRRLCRLARG
jgi:hypothetical protein